MAFHFNTDGDLEGWTELRNITDAVVSNGFLSGRSTTLDPVVFTTNCAINSDQIETIYIKLASGTNRNAAFYWKSNGQFQWMVSTYTNSPDLVVSRIFRTFVLGFSISSVVRGGLWASGQREWVT